MSDENPQIVALLLYVDVVDGEEIWGCEAELDKDNKSNYSHIPHQHDFVTEYLNPAPALSATSQMFSIFLELDDDY